MGVPDATRVPQPRNPAPDPCATITTPGFETLIVCLHCHAELRTWQPETLDAFRAWHVQHCGRSSG